MQLKEKILLKLNELPVFDTHEHWGVWNQWKPQENTLTVEQIFKWNYMSFVGSTKDDYSLLCNKLKREIGNDSFTAIRESLKELYGIDPYPLSPKKMEDLDKKIKEAYLDPDYTCRIMKELGNVTNVIIDIGTESWENWNNQKYLIFDKTIRIDDVIFPFQKLRTNSYDVSNNPNQIETYCSKNGTSLESLDDFEEVLEEYMLSLRQEANVIKIGSAYQRSLNFQMDENENGEISKIYSKIQSKDSKLNQTEVLRWGNFVVTIMLGFATVEKMPVQIHTGLATIKETDPRYLMDIIKAFPGVKFDLFHGGYPYHHSMTAVVAYNENAHANLCWMPMLSQSATKEILHRLIEMRTTGRVFAYGGDCQTVEGSLGALIVLKQLLSEVLAEFVDKNRLNFDDAIELGRQMLWENANNIYK